MAKNTTISTRRMTVLDRIDADTVRVVGRVGDGWQGVESVTVRLEDEYTGETIETRECPAVLGAHWVDHPGRSGWNLIVTIPADLLTEDQLYDLDVRESVAAHVGE